MSYAERAANYKREYMRTVYYPKNRERLKQYQKEYQKKNVEKIREVKKAYNIKNKAYFSEYQKNYRKEHVDDRLLLNRKYKKLLKIEVFSHYSPQLTCQRCGFGDIRALSIDHINGDGAKHRKMLGWGGGGHILYQWLKRNGFPVGFQILCMNCQWIKRNEKEETAKKRVITQMEREKE